MAVNECDLLFSIGTRFNDRITAKIHEFAPKAQIVHVDIDTASISRNVHVDVPIVADAKEATEKMLEYVKKHRDRIYCIVTYRIDRPTRNIQDYYSIILPFLQRNNVTIACINEGFEDILKLEPMILAVYLGMAAQELKNIKTRAKSTVEYRAKNGYTLGKQPVGYLKKNTKDGTIRIDNDKKHYIKQALIMQLHL